MKTRKKSSIEEGAEKVRVWLKKPYVLYKEKPFKTNTFIFSKCSLYVITKIGKMQMIVKMTKKDFKEYANCDWIKQRQT